MNNAVKITMMMLMLILGFGSHANAAVCSTLGSSPSSSTIQSAINACNTAGGGTVQMVTGTTVDTTGITIPCGVLLSGAQVPYSPVHNQTTIFTGPVSGGWGFTYNNSDGSCNKTGGVQYIEWNGEQPSAGGGGALHILSDNSVNNVVIQNNYFHGNMGNINTGHDQDMQVWVDGPAPAVLTNVDSNWTIAWNIFGNSSDGNPVDGDCGPIMNQNYYQGSSIDGQTGFCGGIGLHYIQFNASTINNNIFHFMEQGMKLYECGDGSSGSPLCIYTNVVIKANFFDNIHRIPIETQVSPNPTNNGVPGITYINNVVQNQVYPAWGSWGFSQANIGYNYDYSNLMISNWKTATFMPGAFEFWGNAGNNGLVQGQQPNGYAWGYYQNTSQINYNTFCGPTLNNPSTAIFAAHPEVHPAPTAIGNVYGGTTCHAYQSAAPAISPLSGAQSFPLTVTLTNNGFGPTTALPNGNTDSFCTFDGTTPVPGQSNTTEYATAATGTVTFTLASAPSHPINCSGMYGAANQPKTYAQLKTLTATGGTVAGNTDVYGMTPSNTVSVTYTGGTPTVQTPVITPATGVYGAAQTVSITDSTSGAAIHYTVNGTTPTSSSPTYSAPFTSPTPVSGTPAVIQAIGILSGSTNSSVASVTYTFGQPTAATPVFTPASQTFSGSISPVVASSTSGSTLNCTLDGTIPTTSSTSYSNPHTFGPYTASQQVQCIAQAAGYNTSAVGVGNYTYLLYLGNNQRDVAGQTSTNFFNMIYAVSGSTGNSVASCVVDQGTGAVANGAKTDCLVVLATSSSTQSATPLCKGTYTNTSNTGTVAVIPLTGCNIAANTPYWISTITNDPISGSSLGFWDCGGACTTTPPTSNNGVYQGRYVLGTYGTYTAMPTTTLNVNNNQVSVYLNLAPLNNPTVVSGYQSNTANVNTMNVGDPGVQQIADATYSDGSTGTLPDGNGNTVVWDSTNDDVLSVSSTGVVTCVGAGTANSTATAQPSTASFAPWGWTCNNPTPVKTLVSTYINSPVLFITSPIALTVYGRYSDGTVSVINTGVTWASSDPTTITVDSTGSLTVVKTGDADITATVNGITAASAVVGVTMTVTP